MDTNTRALLQTVPEVRMVATPLPWKDRPTISTSLEADALLRPFFLEEMELRESFRILLLDRGNRVRGMYTVSCGGMHGTVADPKLIFCATLKSASCGLILAHNHPSGQLRPSQEDIFLTKKLVDGARLLDIAVQDHIILGPEGYYSFRDNGMM